jgi:hypothetical protein
LAFAELRHALAVREEYGKLMEQAMNSMIGETAL